jgi:hypothetical protein
MADQVDLDSLVGEHVLDAVDTFSENIKREYGDYYEDCEIIRFRIDGKVYTATEDPSDGYRSCMGALFVSETEPMRNVFPPIRVLAKKKDDDRYGGSNDTLQLIDMMTGKTVLEVGTDNSDDYYPSFVNAFWPEHMVTNQPDVATGERMQGEG